VPPRIDRDVNNDITKEPITMMHTYLPSIPNNSTSVRTDASDRTPGAVIAARIVIVAQGALVLALGWLILSAPADAAVPAALGVASIVEGAVRIALGLLLRRGARIVRKIAVVIGAAGMILGFMTGGFGFVSAAVSFVVVRCLCSEDAREFLGA
jgi:hypothetical protein